MTVIFIGGAEMINAYPNSSGQYYGLFQAWHPSKPFVSCYWTPNVLTQPVCMADYQYGHCGICTDFSEDDIR